MAIWFCQHLFDTKRILNVARLEQKLPGMDALLCNLVGFFLFLCIVRKIKYIYVLKMYQNPIRLERSHIILLLNILADYRKNKDADMIRYLKSHCFPTEYLYVRVNGEDSICEL